MICPDRNSELSRWLGFPSASSPASDPKWQLLQVLRENTYRALRPEDAGKTLEDALVLFPADDGSLASYSIVQLDVESAEWSDSLGEWSFELVAWLPAGVPVQLSCPASSLRASALDH